jgi:hypothetical protein
MKNYVAILTEALNAAAVAPRERGIGCGRIYVSVSSEHAKGVAKAAKKLGKIFQKCSHYGTSNALYVGYDNCDGRALAQGTAIVKVLKAHGISCYRDECGD